MKIKLIETHSTHTHINQIVSNVCTLNNIFAHLWTLLNTYWRVSITVGGADVMFLCTELPQYSIVFPLPYIPNTPGNDPTACQSAWIFF